MSKKPDPGRQAPHPGDALGRCFDCMWAGKLTCPHTKPASGVPGLGDGAERRVEAFIEKRRQERNAGVPGLGDGAERRVEAKAAGLRWCRQCGEGTVAGLCRKGLPAGQCPVDTPPILGVQASDGETIGRHSPGAST